MCAAIDPAIEDVTKRRKITVVEIQKGPVDNKTSTSN